MLAHIWSISIGTKGIIVIGGLITFIIHALNLEVELATLVPIIGSTALDIQACKSQKLIKYEREGRYCLCVKKTVVRSIFFPCAMRTNVQVDGNRLYDLSSDIEVVAPRADAHMHTGTGGDTDEEYDRREQLSPAPSHPTRRHSKMHTSPIPFSHTHTAHHFTNTFVGTTSWKDGSSSHHQSAIEYDHKSLRHEIIDLRLEVQTRNDIDANRDVLFWFIHQNQLGQIKHIHTMQTHIFDMQHMQQGMLEHLRFTQATEAQRNTQMENISLELYSLWMEMFDRNMKVRRGHDRGWSLFFFTN